MKMVAAVRHGDGKKNICEIDGATSHEKARATVLEAFGAKATVLVGIAGGKARTPTIITKESE